MGFPEENFAIADTAQWEVKSHRAGSSSLVTLLHAEPHPRPARVVKTLLLPKYGWPDQRRTDELSFRQTIRAGIWSDRGFQVQIDREQSRLNVAFDSTLVDQRHSAWLATVAARVGLGPLDPAPYWPLQDIELKVSTKMLNSLFVEVEATKSSGREYFLIKSATALQGFSIDGFVIALEEGGVYVDFDARTNHNHGTKFRLKEDALPKLYRYRDVVA